MLQVFYYTPENLQYKYVEYLQPESNTVIENIVLIESGFESLVGYEISVSVSVNRTLN